MALHGGSWGPTNAVTLRVNGGKERAGPLVCSTFRFCSRMSLHEETHRWRDDIPLVSPASSFSR